MVAVDTNVVVRLLTGDEPTQEAVARALFATGPIWIAKTVLLEAGWVLTRVYGFTQEAVVEAFTKLLGLQNVHVEDEPAIIASLKLAANGIDLADAIHLNSTPSGTDFVSFDKPFVKRALQAGAIRISNLPGQK
jgi:predicted nucleic-acid-binding protein